VPHHCDILSPQSVACPQLLITGCQATPLVWHLWVVPHSRHTLHPPCCHSNQLHQLCWVLLVLWGWRFLNNHITDCANTQPSSKYGPCRVCTPNMSPEMGPAYAKTLMTMSQPAPDTRNPGFKTSPAVQTLQKSSFSKKQKPRARTGFEPGVQEPEYFDCQNDVGNWHKLHRDQL
jgi:hypothetical protein